MVAKLGQAKTGVHRRQRLRGVWGVCVLEKRVEGKTVSDRPRRYGIYLVPAIKVPGILAISG